MKPGELFHNVVMPALVVIVLAIVTWSASQTSDFQKGVLHEHTTHNQHHAELKVLADLIGDGVARKVDDRYRGRDAICDWITHLHAHGMEVEYENIDCANSGAINRLFQQSH